MVLPSHFSALILSHLSVQVVDADMWSVVFEGCRLLLRQHLGECWVLELLVHEGLVIGVAGRILAVVVIEHDHACEVLVRFAYLLLYLRSPPLADCLAREVGRASGTVLRGLLDRGQIGH